MPYTQNSGQARARDNAYKACVSPTQAKRVTQFLFPRVATADGSIGFDRTSDIDGCLAHPARLMVALQLNVSPSDVSIDSVRNYLLHPMKRKQITSSLSPENCLEFMELLGDLAQSTVGKGVADLEALCIALAELADTESFAKRSRSRATFFTHRSEDVALRAIQLLVKAVAPERGADIAMKLIKAENALSVAAELMRQSFHSKSDSNLGPVIAAESARAGAIRFFRRHVLKASKNNTILQLSNPRYIFWTLAALAPADCKKVFATLKSAAATLDGFVVELMQHSFDSVKGQTYSLPEDMSKVTAFCALNTLKSHARKRLADSSMGYPTRAAWRSVVEGTMLYAVDGSKVRM